MIGVLLVDDHPLIRKGFRLILEGETDIEVAGEAGDGATAGSMCSALHPDVVLMDIRMPGRDGIEATRDIVTAGLPSKVLILTTFDLDDYVYAGLRAGASGFLLKGCTRDELVNAITKAARGESVFTRDEIRRVNRTLVRRHLTTDIEVTLTRREAEVLRLLVDGLTNNDIAKTLDISYETVKEHIEHIIHKIGVTDRTQAAVWAVRKGLA